MVRLVVYLLGVALAATGLAWLADRPGTLQVAWQGYDIETSVFRATVILVVAIATAIFLWSIVRAAWNSPAAVGERIVRRRQKRGLDALSSGMIAVGAGDKALATQYALQARKSLPYEPLTHLLRAQAAQLSGDRAAARRIFEAMLASPETEQLGLRGLFLEAEREGESEAALQFASRAVRSNPKLGWSSDALFDIQCKQKDWAGALETLSHAKRSGHFDKASADRKRAVLLAGQAQDLEENTTDKALTYALEAHALAPDLVPAAAVAGRILASRGNTGKAAKILQKTWARSPHPDLATTYAYARIGDSTRDRLDRMRQLGALNPHSIESPIAVATTAIDARLYDEARKALEPLLANRLTQRVATLMARIEAGENGDKGRVREWLARAVSAARDPVWFADGVISDRWEPVSPVDGKLDAYQWRVPVETRDKASADLVATRLEELLALSAPDDPDVSINTAAKDPVKAPPVASGRRMDAVDAEAVTVRPAPAASYAKQALAPTPAIPVTEAAVVSRVSTPSKTQPAVNRPAVTPGDSKLTNRAQGQGRPDDSKLYVAPRAPDDPGLDEAEAEAVSLYPKRPFRAVN
jgi:HemY protein